MTFNGVNGNHLMTPTTDEESYDSEPSFHCSKLSLFFAFLIVSAMATYTYHNYKPCVGPKCGPSLHTRLHQLAVDSAVKLGDFQCGYADKSELYVNQLASDYASLLEFSLKPENVALKTFSILNKEGNEVTDITDAYSVVSNVSVKQLRCRVSAALSTVTVGVSYVFLVLFLLIVAYGVGRYWLDQRRMTQARVEKLIEDIMKITQDQTHKTPPYIPVSHVRDMLLTTHEKTKQGYLWDRAVNFLSCNESRLRTENQIIKGEEFTVWHWLSVAPVPSGNSRPSEQPTASRKQSIEQFPQKQSTNTMSRKQSASQISAVSSQSSKNSKELSGWRKVSVAVADINPPSECLKLKNMIPPRYPSGDVDLSSMRQSVADLIHGANLVVRSVDVDLNSDENAVYICCDSLEQASVVYLLIAGQWYNGGEVVVKFLKLDRYLERFPHLKRETPSLSTDHSSVFC